MKYDLHVHTNSSKCSNLKPSKVLEIAKSKGLDGIAITDHNTIKGALKVSKLNKNKNFEVIIGEEIKTDKGEVIGLYLKDEIKPGNFYSVVDQIKDQGGIAIIAHPFAIGRDKVKGEGVFSKIDAIEGVNGRSIFEFENLKAQIKGNELEIAMTAGSDAHFAFEIGTSYTKVDGKLRKAIKNKKTLLIHKKSSPLRSRICTFVYRRILNAFRKNKRKN